jgi:hypothetical protein
MNYDTREINSNVWKPVSTNKVGVKRLIPVQQPQPIPTIVNRFKVLDNLHRHLLTHQQREHANTLLADEKECSGTTNSVSVTQQTNGKEDYSKKAQDRKRNKIVIIGDSHARGCAQEIRHNLKQDYEIDGYVKPGANLQTIVKVPTESLENLQKKLL